MSPSANAAAVGSSKAAHYVQLLDDARCEGNWDAVPELVRKVRKHAYDRLCLTVTAEAECAIARATQNYSPSGNAQRSSAAAPPKDLDLDHAALLPKLTSAIEKEQKQPQDRFQAQVCLGWLHWVVGEYNLAFVRLPKGVNDDDQEVDSLEKLSEWSRVCVLKSAYLRANCLARSEKDAEALAVFQSGIPSLSINWSSQQARAQLRYWSELLLTEFCMLYSHCLENGEASLEDPNCLASFRSWARFWEGTKGTPLTGGHGFRGSVPRRRIWYEYYTALSSILEQDLPFPTAYSSVTNQSSARTQLRVELKRVETTYEALLLDETEFPRADEEREEVEEFVRRVMQNWAILSGKGWREQDLGQGGRDSLSRGVLDILYRASTKTYQSTAILRHLFNVHLAVAEFDLAFKAFDSYIGIVKKGKARVEKTGHQEASLDDDATVLETICLCIAALCRHGDRHAAEKARELSVELEHWLEKIVPAGQNGMGTLREEGGRSSATGDRIPTNVLALVWQAIGLAQAQWGRVTYDLSSRTEIQTKAIRCLRKSLSPEFGRSADLRGVFALGILLAEQRDLTTAIEIVKTALLSNRTGDGRHSLRHGSFWRERALIPLWHLLSLLLSARQDYVMAARACEGAFEQFREPSVLFGSQNLYRSDHLNEAEAKWEKEHEGSKGLVDEMDDFEKESILEIKMTQLALIELLEGPRTAVNASLELLSLFARLFGSVETKATLPPPKAMEVPKSSAGTLRSIKGSIFGSRSERSGRASRRPSILGPSEKAPTTIPLRPPSTQTTTGTAAPTIQVTNENGNTDNRRSRKSSSGTRRSDSVRRRNSLRKRDSSGSRKRAASSGGAPQHPTVVDGEPFFTPMGEGTQPSDFFSFSSRRRPSSSQGPPLSRGISQLSQVEPPQSPRSRSSELAGIAADSVEPTGASLPIIQFSKEHETRSRAAILVRVWLMIAGLYRRAGMHNDAKAAIAEAQKLVQGMEVEAVRDSSGPGSLSEPGWAHQKSIEELWGDVWTEMGHLELAKEAPYLARNDFESALTHFPNHPSAIIGLSNILLDVYGEKLLPPAAIPSLELTGGSVPLPGADETTADIVTPPRTAQPAEHAIPSEPLGLRNSKLQEQGARSVSRATTPAPNAHQQQAQLSPPYKTASIPIVDRLAARDRAYGLLSGLTKLGSGWNNAEAWFALARAHEESGQPDKAKEVLWWCVELEEGTGVRDWQCVGVGRYVL